MSYSNDLLLCLLRLNIDLQDLGRFWWPWQPKREAQYLILGLLIAFGLSNQNWDPFKCHFWQAEKWESFKLQGNN